jgi:hypothetical protein
MEKKMKKFLLVLFLCIVYSTYAMQNYYEYENVPRERIAAHKEFCSFMRDFSCSDITDEQVQNWASRYRNYKLIIG